jgi:lipopolysaccharide/colanic/teichoic acid biosynthesis glycosyltransferase
MYIMERRVLRSGYSAPKRVFDVAVASLALAVLSPVLAVIALAVKLFGGAGPVIFRGQRVGRLGKHFQILKFRSMRAGVAGGSQLTAGRDERVTAVGALLRAAKLDELPQLWNVIRGDMSIVGPRPEAPEFVAHYTPEQRSLLLVRPGITGAAALEYRNEEAVLAQVEPGLRENFYIHQLLPQELATELEYLDNWSFGRDLILIARTALAVVTGLGLGHPSPVPDRRERLVPRSTLPLLAVDCVAWCSGLAVALVLRHGRVFNVRGEQPFVGALVTGATLAIVGWVVGIYRGRFAVGRFQEAGAVAVAQASVVALYFTGYLLFGRVPVGRGTIAVAAYWALVPMLGARYCFRYWRSRRVQPPSPFSRRVLVYGAGRAAHQIIPALLFDPTSRYRPIGIIEDDPSKRHRSVEGVSVVGNRGSLAAMAARYHVDALLIAMPSANARMINDIADLAHAAGLDVIMLPAASDLFVSAPLSVVSALTA